VKATIHPKWYEDAKITCACGNTFTVGATVPEIQVEVCYNCHPFYTGKMKFVDTAGRVDAFKARTNKAMKKVLSKTEKRRIKREKKIQKELERPDTLAELRKQARKSPKKKAGSTKIN
jgi:large subunit ribosomal protein L31